jgi:signal transduction histidine kinase
MNEVEAAEPGSGAAWGGTGETVATGAPGALSGRPGFGDRRPRMLQWTLSRIAGALGLLGLVFVAATIAVLAFEQRERGERETRQDLQDTAFFLADHAARLFEVSDVVLRSATAKIEGATWEEIASSEDLFRRLRAAKGPVPYVEDVWLNDANGDLRLTTFAFPSPRSNASDREPFRFHRQPNDRLHVGERIVGRITGRPSFLLSRRLTGADGSFRGMVSVTAELSYFDHYWSRVRLPLDAQVTLFRTDDRDALAQSGGDVAGRAELFRAAVGANPREGFAEIADGASGPRLAAHRQVADLPVHVGVSVSRAAMDRLWHERIDNYALFAGGAFLTLAAFTGLAFLQARRETAAQAEIEAARSELATANTRLEATVAERTAELRDSNEEIQRFAYIVSHDLRSPLVNIMGFTSELETLRADVKAELKDNPNAEILDRDIAESLGFIKASTAKMDRLIKAILALSREGRQPLQSEPIVMKDLVSGIAATLQHQLDAAGATLLVGDLPPLVSDRLAAEQIFGNLLDNAVKYGDPARPPRIEVSGRDAGGVLVYEVRDNGRGIDPGDHGRVFDLFRRSGAQDRPGEGIGLAHVRQLVRKLGGRIELFSAPGEGATFRLTFPKRPAEALTEAA